MVQNVSNALAEVSNTTENVINSAHKVSNTFEKYIPLFRVAGITDKSNDENKKSTNDKNLTII